MESDGRFELPLERIRGWRLQSSPLWLTGQALGGRHLKDPPLDYELPEF